MFKYKVDAYVRLSYIDDKSNESDSAVNQKNLIKDFVNLTPDIKLVDFKVDDEAARVVKQIFEWFAYGSSMNEIVLKLNNKQIPAPGMYEKEKAILSNSYLIGSGNWNTRAVDNILKNPLYTGNLIQGTAEYIDKVRYTV